MKLPNFMSRRRFLGGVSLAAAASFGYARFLEPGWLQLTRSSVPIGDGRMPIQLLHLSDLHASACVSLDFIGEAIEAGLALDPDLICITGDFITNTWDRQSEYVSLLKRLSSAAPCYAVLGNHDGGLWSAEHGGLPDVSWATTLLSRSGIRLLENESETVTARDWKLMIAGAGDGWAGLLNPAKTFAGIENSEQPTILLSHNPDTKEDFLPYRWNLMLCGHTHGGQLRVPFIGAPFAPVQDKRFLAGLYRWKGRHLHITRGVGNVHGMRINCRPEISLLALS